MFYRIFGLFIALMLSLGLVVSSVFSAPTVPGTPIPPQEFDSSQSLGQSTPVPEHDPLGELFSSDDPNIVKFNGYIFSGLSVMLPEGWNTWRLINYDEKALAFNDLLTDVLHVDQYYYPESEIEYFADTVASGVLEFAAYGPGSNPPNDLEMLTVYMFSTQALLGDMEIGSLSGVEMIQAISPHHSIVELSNGKVASFTLLSNSSMVTMEVVYLEILPGVSAMVTLRAPAITWEERYIVLSFAAGSLNVSGESVYVDFGVLTDEQLTWILDLSGKPTVGKVSIYQDMVPNAFELSTNGYPFVDVSRSVPTCTGFADVSPGWDLFFVTDVADIAIGFAPTEGNGENYSILMYDPIFGIAFCSEMENSPELAFSVLTQGSKLIWVTSESETPQEAFGGTLSISHVEPEQEEITEP